MIYQHAIALIAQLQWHKLERRSAEESEIPYQTSHGIQSLAGKLADHKLQEFQSVAK